MKKVSHFLMSYLLIKTNDLMSTIFDENGKAIALVFDRNQGVLKMAVSNEIMAFHFAR